MFSKLTFLNFFVKFPFFKKDLVGNAEDEGGNEATETEADDKEDKASQSES